MNRDLLKLNKIDNILYIKLPSLLDKNNAPEVLNLININLDSDINKLVFDAENLKYISADGLDVILELKKKYKDILIDNARIGIYDTLSLYGFNYFVDINKKYRFISTDGCEVIGEGGHGIIYKIGEDTILKVYKDHSPIEIIEKERLYARNAFTNGISTPIVYDVVETKQGFGVIFEMINGMTLGQYLNKHPDKLDEYSEKFSDLLYTLHHTVADSSLYEDFEDMLLERADASIKYISQKDVDIMKKIIKSIPKGNGMIHGDFHPNNVMIDSEGELVLIDMADIARGNGFYDLGGSYLIMKFLPELPFMGIVTKNITSIPGKSCLRMWNILMHRYFKTDDESILEKFDKQYKAFARLRISTSLGMNTSHGRLLRKIMAIYTKIFVLPNADKYIKLFSNN